MELTVTLAHVTASWSQMALSIIRGLILVPLMLEPKSVRTDAPPHGGGCNQWAGLLKEGDPIGPVDFHATASVSYVVLESGAFESELRERVEVIRPLTAVRQGV
ncbi:hypothetical protein JOQ06_000402 [Pogonophryne albipinna]|uniref:Uncharacterized protein n=1 Tax=Pogonophryne albipinna TaxID=1090488 RepID=A0AAD6F809_9TELE|nr:hypothetical protein JOQ06_000402 [Pogonophryne albipinna]